MSLTFIKITIKFLSLYVYLGGWDESYKNDIYQFDPSDGAWHYFGSMALAREYHAVELVQSDRFGKYCR